MNEKKGTKHTSGALINDVHLAVGSYQPGEWRKVTLSFYIQSDEVLTNEEILAHTRVVLAEQLTGTPTVI